MSNRSRAVRNAKSVAASQDLNSTTDLLYHTTAQRGSDANDAAQSMLLFSPLRIHTVPFHVQPKPLGPIAMLILFVLARRRSMAVTYLRRSTMRFVLLQLPLWLLLMASQSLVISPRCPAICAPRCLALCVKPSRLPSVTHANLTGEMRSSQTAADGLVERRSSERVSGVRLFFRLPRLPVAIAVATLQASQHPPFQSA
jgi:hypothetical protein